MSKKTIEELIWEHLQNGETWATLNQQGITN
jgi:hypothetical protein